MLTLLAGSVDIELGDDLEKAKAKAAAIMPQSPRKIVDGGGKVVAELEPVERKRRTKVLPDGSIEGKGAKAKAKAGPK